MHVSDIPAAGSIESSLRQAATAGLVADADFATDEATTLANIDARNANVRPDLVPAVERAKAAVRLGFNILGDTVMISDLAGIYAACEGGDWAPGFGVAM